MVGERGWLTARAIHTFSLSPPTHRTRGWFPSTHSRVACSSVGRNNVMLCYVSGARRAASAPPEMVACSAHCTRSTTSLLSLIQTS